MFLTLSMLRDNNIARHPFFIASILLKLLLLKAHTFLLHGAGFPPKSPGGAGMLAAALERDSKRSLNSIVIITWRHG